MNVGSQIRELNETIFRTQRAVSKMKVEVVIDSLSIAENCDRPAYARYA